MCTPHQYQHSSHDPHLWWGFKCHRKDTSKTHGGVSRSWEVTLELGGEPREEHSPVGEDWGHDGMEIEFRRSGQEGEKWR